MHLGKQRGVTKTIARNRKRKRQIRSIRLNKDKCESISYGEEKTLKGNTRETKQKKNDEAKHKGCYLNKDNDIAQELNKRKSEVCATSKKLQKLWFHSSCNMRFKLIVYDAIITTKLLYVLKSTHP